MSTALTPRTPPAHRSFAERGPRWNRIVVGLLLTALGVGWLVDASGVTVPWRLVPAAVLVLIGVMLLLSLLGGRGRADLVVIGGVALLAAIGVGVGVDRFAGGVGDRTVVPAVEGWPAEPVRLSAGTVLVDLTDGPLPAGRLDVAVGAGEVVIRVPEDAAVAIDTRVVTGTVTVDGTTVREGVDLGWSRPGPRPATVVVEIGTGELEIDHVPA